MARQCNPYHSKDSDIYHIYSDCTEGNNIEADNRKAGDAKRLCKNCKEIRDGKRKR